MVFFGVICIWCRNFGYKNFHFERKITFNITRITSKYEFPSAISHSSIGDLPGKISPRIVGGQQTTIERFPWQLSLRIHGSHRCGASVISENRALTAAHCRRNDNSADFTVLGGSTLRFGDQHSFIIRLNRFIQHPNFNNLTMENGMTI